MNTVIVAPISSSKKYTREQKYIESPFFIDISDQEIKGTALLQHIRAVDPKVRAEEPKTHLSADKINLVGQVLKEFF